MCVHVSKCQFGMTLCVYSCLSLSVSMADIVCVFMSFSKCQFGMTLCVYSCLSLSVIMADIVCVFMTLYGAEMLCRVKHICWSSL